MARRPVALTRRDPSSCTDISRWEEIGKVHGELFEGIRPATTMVQVAKLIDDAALVEIEADAVVL